MAEYVLFGAYASYYTAKVRTYLRKKGIPFVERLPSDRIFREVVRPASGSHRIPQVMTPDGEVLQDSVHIVDKLEPLFPSVPAFPTSPRQRVFVHLMELLGSEGLLSLAWQHRWLFAENQPFITRDFGRTFRPQGSDEDLLKYGGLISDRMMSYGLPPATETVKQALDDAYIALLGLFESHLLEHPYLLGGQPTQADYSVMGALHAHMGRDPAGLRLMQNHGPRTLRWVEQMLLPELVAPEFSSRPVVVLADDVVPASALDLLNHLGTRYGLPFLLGALAFDDYCDQAKLSSGDVIDADLDQPKLPSRSVSWAEQTYYHSAQVYAEWLSQRARTYFATLAEGDQSTVLDAVGNEVLVKLLSTPVRYPLTRRNNRFYLV